METTTPSVLALRSLTLTSPSFQVFKSMRYMSHITPSKHLNDVNVHWLENNLDLCSPIDVHGLIDDVEHEVRPSDCGVDFSSIRRGTPTRWQRYGE